VSDETWRPLPRREWSVRSDYQVLLGTNRHTVNATGWTQEENNLKTALTAERNIRATQPHLAREYGVARYERIRDTDFNEADHYYESTKAFWRQVQQTWSEIFVANKTVTLRAAVDQQGLFKPLFQHADAIAEGKLASKQDDAAVIRSALRDMGALK
jgi:hypothetical protein